MFRLACRTVISTVFPSSSLFPMSDPGGVVYPAESAPGYLRPFSATLAVPMPRNAKKHDTTSTSPATSTPTQRSLDGRVESDVQSDRGSDS
jgi:hypothetical protein